MSEPRTVGRLLEIGLRVLKDSTHVFEDHDFEAQARELMALVLSCDDDELPADDFEPDVHQRERFLSLIARRAAGEPFPFLTGHIEFWGLNLEVVPGPFVPRPSSELTVEWAVGHIEELGDDPAPVLVEVAAGTGPIALALAHDFPSAEVWALDIDKTALAQGRRNAQHLGIENITFEPSDMYGNLPARLREGVFLIAGHVPYVHPDELEDLPTEVREYEPMYTLTDESDDGLDLMRRAVREAVEWLQPGGWLLLEMAEDLSWDIEQLLKAEGFKETGVVEDEDALSVVVEGRKPFKTG